MPYHTSHSPVGPLGPWFDTLRFLGYHCITDQDGQAFTSAYMPLATCSLTHFEKIPERTIATFIPDWANVLLSSPSCLDLEIINISHHKQLDSKHKHEFLLFQVLNHLNGYVWYFFTFQHISPQYDRITFHLVVQRSVVQSGPSGATDAYSCARDTLSILSKGDVSHYSAIPTIYTFFWQHLSFPPFHEVLSLLILIKERFTQFYANNFDCHHFAAVASFAIQIYRPTNHATKLVGKGTRSGVFKPVAGITTSNQVQVIMDGITIFSLFYEHQLGIRRNIPVT